MNIQDGALTPNKIHVQAIPDTLFQQKNVSLDVLRLDELHPVVSGNKWYKLKYYINKAMQQQQPVLTFGGAYSNHIVATAFACKQVGLRCAGIIRGERPSLLSPTLADAQNYGMELHFVSRADYRSKRQLLENANLKHYYVIGEGGYGPEGALGASEILRGFPLADYSHIVAAVGTGTMLAGLITGAQQHQNVIGISSMKNNTGLEADIKNLLPDAPLPPFTVLHQFHFGGYAATTPLLIETMNKAWYQHRLPLDIVYTGKTYFAINALVADNYFKAGSRLLMIHSGGLQGNRSLGQNVLAF